MTDIKVEVNDNNSVIFQESKPVSGYNDDSSWSYSVDSLTSIFDNANSVSSIQKDNLNYSDAEKLKEDYDIMALEGLIYNAINEGRIKEARELLEQFGKYSSPLIDKWKNAFSHLSIKKTGIASLQKNEIEEESNWKHKNSKFYISKWVALISGVAIASSNNLEDLKKEVERTKKTNDITFLKL